MRDDFECEFNGEYSRGRYRTIIQFYKAVDDVMEPLGDEYDITLYEGQDLSEAMLALDSVAEDCFPDEADTLYASVRDFSYDEPDVVDDLYLTK